MNKTLQILILLLFFGVLFSIPALADAPPDPGGDPGGSGGTPVGGGAPIGGGLLIMLISGIFYGVRKTVIAFRSGKK